MRALPIGVPKLIVSTLASGDTRPYVGESDIAMLYPVVDIAGLNRDLGTDPHQCRRGHRRHGRGIGRLPADGMTADRSSRPRCSVSPRPASRSARERLEALGYEVLVFHATGTGGRAMEGLARAGLLAGVLDVTTTELADELVGGVLSAGPERLEAAGACGHPAGRVGGRPRHGQLRAAWSRVPARFAGRTFHRHDPTVTLMRTTRRPSAPSSDA